MRILLDKLLSTVPSIIARISDWYTVDHLYNSHFLTVNTCHGSFVHYNISFCLNIHRKSCDEKSYQTNCFSLMLLHNTTLWFHSSACTRTCPKVLTSISFSQILNWIDSRELYLKYLVTIKETSNGIYNWNYVILVAGK